MSLQSFCSVPIQFANQTTNFTRADAKLEELKSVFKTLQIVFCVIGIGGNLLNILTLRSPSLHSVPFLYIRAMAIFDLAAGLVTAVSLNGCQLMCQLLELLIYRFCTLSTPTIHIVIIGDKRPIGLTLVALHSLLVRGKALYYKQMFYWTYVDASAINTFLVTSFYCAILLTIERFILITYPHSHRSLNPRKWAQIKIAILFIVCTIIHLPMALQNRLVFNEANKEWERKNNVEFLCKEPMFTVYNSYKIFREAIRIICALVLVVLNVFITRRLQIAKRNRRKMILRSKSTTKSACNRSVVGQLLYSQDLSADQEKARRENSTLMKSFTEKRLTALLVAICIIFIIGNIPQVFVMILQHENRETNYSFQLFRNIANALEVLNHCLNFYVFCLASRDYTRAFLHNVTLLRNILNIPFRKQCLHQHCKSNSVEMKIQTPACPAVITCANSKTSEIKKVKSATTLKPESDETTVAITISSTRTTFLITSSDPISENQDSEEYSIFV